MFIIKKISGLFVKSNKSKYCGCDISTDDTYCTFSCAINDNKQFYNDNTHTQSSPILPNK